MDVIKISGQTKMPIYVQIAKQFKDRIGAGEFRKGDALPGRQALAGQLGVNINTINHAYRILENDGFIYSRRGIGSFVNPEVEHKAKTELVAEISDQLKALKLKALAWGWTIEEFGAMIQKLLPIDSGTDHPRAVFVECDRAWTDDLAVKLQSELGLDVRPVVLPDRKTNLREVIQAITDADVVITTHVHFDEVRKIAGAGKFVWPLDMHLSYEVMAELGKIKDARIGVPFLRPVTIKRIDHWIKAVGFKIDLVPIRFKDTDELVAKSREFTTLMTTDTNAKKLKELLPDSIKILTVISVLGEQSIQHLKESFSGSGLFRASGATKAYSATSKP